MSEAALPGDAGLADDAALPAQDPPAPDVAERERARQPAPAPRPQPAPAPAVDLRALVESARRRGFYPLVQLLERLGGAPVGTSASPADEHVRFRHDPSLTFSTADVVSVRSLPEDAPEPTAFEVTTTFLGLTGATGPLPYYIAEEVAQEGPGPGPLTDFLDIFHHRLISFYYRARAKYDVPAGWRTDLADAWSPRMLALLGVDAAQPPPAGFEAWRLLHLAPLLAERDVTAHALEVALADLLGDELGGASVAVEPFAGGWIEIAEPDQNKLGLGASRLGVDLVLGRHVVDVAGKFRVVFGPLSGEVYRRFAAGEPVRRAEQLIAALVTEPIEHEIVLWLADEAAPAARLGASRLGKDCWLGGQRQTRIRVAGSL